MEEAIHNLLDARSNAHHCCTIAPCEGTAIVFAHSKDVGQVIAEANLLASDLSVTLPAKRVGPRGHIVFRIVPPILLTGPSFDLAVTTSNLVLAHIVLNSCSDTPLAYRVEPSSTVDALGCVDITAAIPDGSGTGDAVILCNLSIAGREVPLGDSPVQVIIGFNHAPSPVGLVTGPARAGNVPALVRALEDGGSTQEADPMHQGRTPLHFAAYNGHSEAVQLLLAAGADLTATDSAGSAPLHYAAMFKNTEAVRLLLEAGADVLATDFQGWTPLHGAVVYGHTEAVRLLLAAGADVTVANRAGKTALDLAQRVGNAEVVKLLSGVEDSPSPAATSCMLQ